MAGRYSVDEILMECALHLGKGLGGTAVNDDAWEWWREHFRGTFTKGLYVHKKDWNQSRRFVLEIATKAGRHAAGLAGTGPVTQPIAEQVAQWVSDLEECADLVARFGIGKFCEFA